MSETKGRQTGFHLGLVLSLYLIAIGEMRADPPDPTVDAQPARPSAE